MKPIALKEARQPLSVETNVSIETFVVLVRSGIELWSRAGEMLVKLVEENPNVYAEIIEKNQSITFEMLLAFERMGRKQIYPPLLMDTSPGAKKLLELPYEMQEKFCKEPVEVVISDNGDSPIVEKRYVKELTGYEARVVFSDERPRTVSEQVEFKKKHKPQGKPKRTTIKTVGTFLLKLSPSGAVVIEKSTATVGLQSVKLFEKDGVKQCLIRLIE